MALPAQMAGLTQVVEALPVALGQAELHLRDQLLEAHGAGVLQAQLVLHVALVALRLQPLQVRRARAPLHRLLRPGLHGDTELCKRHTGRPD